MKTIFKEVNKRDGRLLVDWWNANTKWYHFLKKNAIGKLYSLKRM